MGLQNRLSSILLNLIIMLPLIILLLASAIISSISANDVKSLGSEMNKVYKMITYSTLILWATFGISLLGSIFVSMFASWPYLFAGLMFIFVILNVSLAGVFFYSVNKISNTASYKKKDSKAVRAHKNLLGIGIAMVISSILVIIYTFWDIYRYRKEGGLSGDVVLTAQAIPYIAPQFAPIAAVVEPYAQQQLNPQQQAEVQQRQAGLQTLLGENYGNTGLLKDISNKGIKNTIMNNPQLISKAMNALY